VIRQRAKYAAQPTSRFLRWRDDQKIEPFDAPTFWLHFEPLCKRVGVRIVTKDGKVYCVGVKLAA
jgi:hypothetical protein